MSAGTHWWRLAICLMLVAQASACTMEEVPADKKALETKFESAKATCKVSATLRWQGNVPTIFIQEMFQNPSKGEAAAMCLLKAMGEKIRIGFISEPPGS